MDEQERKLLEEAVELSRENNVMVRKLVAYNRRSTILRIVYWVIIIGSSIAAYNSIQPYITQLIGIYSGQDISQILDVIK